MTTTLKTGKKPAQDRPKDFKFSKYEVQGVTVPAKFGFGNAFDDWGMLGNDQYGDCVWAGGDHETMLLNWAANGAVAGQPSPVSFTAQNALADYGSTGFNPNDPSTDQGTDVGQALEYRRKTGLVDAKGNRHKIAAYVRLDVKNLDHLYAALYLFEVVGIGFEFPGSAMDQFNQGKPWDVVSGATIDGGHYVPLVGRKQTGQIDCVTWGQTQTMTEAFYLQYNDEAYGILSLEGLSARSATNYGGYNWQQLVADAGLVGTLSNDPGPAPAPPKPAPTVTPDEHAYFNWGWVSGVAWEKRQKAA